MSIDDAEMVREFLTESYENLDRLDRELVSLEKDPQNRDALAGVFRTIHTIKGTCGFLGFGKLEKVAHVGENLLSLLRDGKLLLTPEITTALLAMVDAVRQILGQIQATGQEGNADNTQLLADLTRLHAMGINPEMRFGREADAARCANAGAAHGAETGGPAKARGCRGGSKTRASCNNRSRSAKSGGVAESRICPGSQRDFFRCAAELERNHPRGRDIARQAHDARGRTGAGAKPAHAIFQPQLRMPGCKR